MRSPYVGLNGIRSAFYLSQPPESQVLVDGAAVAATAARAQRHLTAALATSYRSLQCPTQARSTPTQSAQIRAVLPHVVSPPEDAPLPSTQPAPRTAARISNGRRRRRMQPSIPRHTPRHVQKKPRVPMAFTRRKEPERKFDNEASLRRYAPRSYRACQPCPRRPLHSASGCDAGAASYYESSTSLNLRASLASFSAASVAANLAITAAITSLSLSVVLATGAALVGTAPAASA